MTKGGKRPGAGAPRKTDRKVSLTVRLPPHQTAWLGLPKNAGLKSVLVEWALYKTYGLKRPKITKGKS